MDSRTNRIRVIIRVYPIGLALQANMATLSLDRFQKPYYQMRSIESPHTEF
jgi:hypothetical protein